MSVLKDVYDVSKDVVNKIKIIEKDAELTNLNSEYQKIIWELVDENKELRMKNFELTNRYKPLTNEELERLNLVLDENVINMLSILEVDMRTVLKNAVEPHIKTLIANSLKKSNKPKPTFNKSGK